MPADTRDDEPGGSVADFGKGETSNHSTWRKTRFTLTWSSLSVGGVVMVFGKDIYFEKLGADPVALGVLFFIISFASPASEIAAGALQGKEALKRWFPVESWGRKAPWLVTHSVMTAVAAGAIFCPPKGMILMHGWFLFFGLLLTWGVANMIIAFESVRQELYQFNEERSKIEVLSKLLGALGIFLAALPLLVIMGDMSPLSFRATLFIAAGFLTLLSLACAIPAYSVWLEANSKNEEDTHNFIKDLRETLKTNSFRKVTLARVFEGFYAGIHMQNALYYVTYILRLKGVERSYWVIFIAVTQIISDVGAGSIVANFLKTRRNAWKLQSAVLICRCINLIMTIAFLGAPLIVYGPQLTSLDDKDTLMIERILFVVWLSVNRGLVSPFSFWRISAVSWVIDEDIQDGDGKRREASFISVSSAMQNFARAMGSALVFFGYGIAGLKPLECDSECAIANSMKSDRDCLESCAERSIAEQPDSSRWYIRLVFLAALTVIEFLLIIAIGAFPIRGIRLARLYNKQVVACGGAIDEGSRSAQMRKLRNQVSVPNLVNSQAHGRAVNVLDQTNVGDAVRSVGPAIRQQRYLGRYRRTNTSTSVSVVFADVLEDIRADADTRRTVVDRGSVVTSKGNAKPNFWSAMDEADSMKSHQSVGSARSAENVPHEAAGLSRDVINPNPGIKAPPFPDDTDEGMSSGLTCC